MSDIVVVGVGITHPLQKSLNSLVLFLSKKKVKMCRHQTIGHDGYQSLAKVDLIFFPIRAVVRKFSWGVNLRIKGQ